MWSGRKKICFSRSNASLDGLLEAYLSVMLEKYVLSVDGACSGKRAACAAVLSINGGVVRECSRNLPEVDGYVLAAEIAGVALANELIGGEVTSFDLLIEVDNPDVPRVIEESYRPKQFCRIPKAILEAAVGFCQMHNARFCVMPRNSTRGLRRADRLASKRLWRKL